MRLENAFPDNICSDQEEEDIENTDDDGGDQQMSGLMSDWLDMHQEGQFDFNLSGRHVLHEMVETWRKAAEPYNKGLFVEAVRLTYVLFGHMNVKTIGIRPERTTP